MEPQAKPCAPAQLVALTCLAQRPTACISKYPQDLHQVSQWIPRDAKGSPGMPRNPKECLEIFNAERCLASPWCSAVPLEMFKLDRSPLPLLLCTLWHPGCARCLGHLTLLQSTSNPTCQKFCSVLIRHVSLREWRARQLTVTLNRSVPRCQEAAKCKCGLWM